MNKEMLEVKLKIISPIHIGSGDEVDTIFGMHISNGRANIIDRKKLEECFSNKLNILNNIIKMIKKERLNEAVKLIKETCGNSIYSDEIDIFSPKDIHPTNIIKEIIKVREKPYIPGSSIIGTLQSFLIYKFNKERRIRGEEIKKLNRKHFLRVEDSKPIERYYISYIKIINNKGKEGRPFFSEMLSPGEETVFKITKMEYIDTRNINQAFFKEIYQMNLKEILNEWTNISREFIMKDAKFWESVKENTYNINIKEIANVITNFYNELLNTNKRVIMLGGYTKAHSALRPKREPRSRSIAYWRDRYLPIGLAEIDY